MKELVISTTMEEFQIEPNMDELSLTYAMPEKLQAFTKYNETNASLRTIMSFL